jgi:hypothetical protein
LKDAFLQDQVQIEISKRAKYVTALKKKETRLPLGILNINVNLLPLP